MKIFTIEAGIAIDIRIEGGVAVLFDGAPALIVGMQQYLPDSRKIHFALWKREEDALPAGFVKTGAVGNGRCLPPLDFIAKLAALVPRAQSPVPISLI